LQAGEPFTPTLKESTGGKKRKNKRGGDQGPRKRQRTDEDDFDDIDNSESSELDTSDSDSDSDDETSNKTRSDNEGGDKDDEDMEEVTEESLKEKIQGCKDSIKAIRERHNEARVRKKEASDTLSSLEKMNVKMQKEKNAFCSLKRSEVSKYPHIFPCLKLFGSSRVTSLRRISVLD
jgi:hypothetical protein